MSKVDDDASLQTTKRISYQKGILRIKTIIHFSFLFVDSEDGILLRGVDCDDPDFRNYFMFYINDFKEKEE